MLELGICVSMLVLSHVVQIKVFIFSASCVMVKTFFLLQYSQKYLLLQKADSLFKHSQLSYAINSWLLARGRGVLPYKGLMGRCGQPGYVFRDVCLKQDIDFIIFLS